MQKQNIIFKSGITLVVSLLFFVNVTFSQLSAGDWSGFIRLNDSVTLSLNFDIEYGERNSYVFVFKNADERIEAKEIKIIGDSLFLKIPVFDSEFKIKFKHYKMDGVWINHARKDKNVLAFHAYAGRPLTKPSLEEIITDWNGKWESTFSPGTKDSSKAIGLFKDSTNFIGTFLTETGDYRFLEGYSYNETFQLSCFDGSHAFLFTGKVKGDSIINGHFYSGAHHHEPWVAKRNDKFELRNPDSLTFLKPGFTKVDFNFKNLDGKNVSLQDEKFKNKVVIIQIMGTWCPNCMDETKFLAPFYDKYNSKGLEVVALAFERTDDFNKAVNNIQRSKTRFNADYEFLITMKTGKNQASEALPMLNEVMAFPTTIYIDKKGVVRKIYTGFNGPATGDAYTKFVEETTRFVEKLLAE